MTRSLLILDADYESLRRIGPWLATEVAEVGADALNDRVGEVELAVHELAANVVDHAYDDTTRPTATLELSMWSDESKLIVQSEDRGREFEAADQPVIGDEPTVHGYGLFILEQLAERVDYERVGGLNRWTLVFG